MAPRYNFEIGTSEGTMVNLEELTVPVFPPFWSYREFREVQEAMDHSLRGFGPASVLWRWGYLTNAQRDQLRIFCTGVSSQVYIRTRRFENSNEYVIFRARMVWPTEEVPSAHVKLDFSITFIVLEEIEEEE